MNKLFIFFFIIFLSKNVHAQEVSPLIRAIITDDEKAVAELLDNGVAINEDFSNGYPLVRALEPNGGSLPIMKLLLDHGADPNGGWFPLVQAAAQGKTEFVKLLVERGADVHVEGGAALVGASCNNYEVVKYLLEQGANVNVVSYHRTPLGCAAESGHKDIAQLLLNNGEQVNVNDNLAKQPIEMALWAGQKEMIDFLLQKGALADPFVLAALGNVDELQSSNVNTSTIDSNERTLLHAAAKYNQKDTMNFLLKKGVDINTKDKDGNTALHYVVLGRQKIAAEFLIQAGADINAQTNKQAYGIGEKTPLHMAVGQKNEEMIKLLLTSKANTEIEDQSGRRPYDYLVTQVGVDHIVQLYNSLLE